MKKIILGCMFCFAPVQALLPPLYETIREYKSLIEDPQLAKKLDSSDMIQSIERHDDQFVVKTFKGKELLIQVVYEPQKMPGPAHFHFRFIDSK